MSEQSAAVVDRSATATSQLVKSVDELLGLIPQLEKTDEFHVLSVAEESDLARFDLQCRIFAKHGRKHELKDYLSEYNRLAARNGWRTIEYTSHAHHMADVGKRFLESENCTRANQKRAGKSARMTEDFWALPKSYFTEALAAGDKFFVALDMAQEKLEAHVRDPKVPRYTISEFRAAISPPTKSSSQTTKNGPQTVRRSDNSSESSQNSPEPPESVDDSQTPSEPIDPVTELFGRAREELGEERLQETLERAITGVGEPEPAIDVEGGEVEEEELPTSQRTCYGCRQCHEVPIGQRLSLAEVDAEEQVTEMLGLFVPCPAWYCAKTRQLLSVHVQRHTYAQSVAADCGAFELRETDEDPDEQTEGGEEHVSVDALMGEG